MEPVLNLILLLQMVAEGLAVWILLAEMEDLEEVVVVSPLSEMMPEVMVLAVKVSMAEMEYPQVVVQLTGLAVAVAVQVKLGKTAIQPQILLAMVETACLPTYLDHQ